MGRLCITTTKCIHFAYYDESAVFPELTSEHVYRYYISSIVSVCLKTAAHYALRVSQNDNIKKREYNKKGRSNMQFPITLTK